MFTRKQKLIGGGILALVGAVAVAAAVVWYAVLPHDSPSQVTLTDAVASLNSPESGTAAAATPAAPQTSDLAGTWRLAANGESFVGYRVKEELARIGTTTAVGRTSDLTATLQFDGEAITDVRVEADLTSLQSDSAMRDGALRQQALETNRYPTASFVLTQPIALDGVPEEGVPVTATAVGDLTLHGVTRSISIDLRGQRTDGLVVVVGSTDIRFADYGIAQPRAAAVLSVEDHGTLELQLVFEKAAQG